MSNKLLLISSNSSGRGGGEKYLIYLAKGLNLLGYEVHSLISSASYMDGWAKALRQEGAVVHRRNLKGLRQRPLRCVQSMLDREQQDIVAQLCRSVAPAAILVNQQYDEDGLDYLAGALKAQIAPVAGVMHMPMTAQKNERPFGAWRGRLLHSWYKRHPYRLILVSEGSQKEFNSYYGNVQPTFVVNNSCEFSEVSKADELPDISWPQGWSDSTPIIGFVGQFVPQKNLKALVQAWAYSCKKHVRSRLLLVGDGPERASLERLLSSVELSDNWHITGWQSNPGKYISKMDVFAMSSHFEGLPLSLIESSGRCLPAVVTNFNGAADVARKASWVTVSDSSSAQSLGDAIADTIRKLPSLKADAERGQAEFRDYFSLPRMAKETLAVLGVS